MMLSMSTSRARASKMVQKCVSIIFLGYWKYKVCQSEWEGVQWPLLHSNDITKLDSSCY